MKVGKYVEYFYVDVVVRYGNRGVGDIVGG